MKPLDPSDQDALAPPALLDAIAAALRGAGAVQIVGHVRPDGDCIGSMLAMHHLLDQWGIAHALAASVLPTGGYDVLPGYERIRERPDAAFIPDLTVYLDCATEERGPDGWRSPAPIVNIDHHETNSRYGLHLWIEPRASSVGEMLFYLIQRADARLTPELATVLLIALTTDTGSFRFGNTGPRQHRIAARLIEAGASPREVARIAYDSLPLGGAHLMGHMFQNIRLTTGGRLAWSEIRRETFRACGGEEVAPENLCDCLRHVRGVEVALLFHELPGGGIRVNFRSTGQTNVSRLAAVWGGGGHAAAAGLTLETGDYAALRDQILRRAVEALG
jgi:phosphoesterase RecJ-like protein